MKRKIKLALGLSLGALVATTAITTMAVSCGDPNSGTTNNGTNNGSNNGSSSNSNSISNLVGSNGNIVDIKPSTGSSIAVPHNSTYVKLVSPNGKLTVESAYAGGSNAEKIIPLSVFNAQDTTRKTLISPEAEKSADNAGVSKATTKIVVDDNAITYYTVAYDAKGDIFREETIILSLVPNANGKYEMQDYDSNNPKAEKAECPLTTPDSSVERSVSAMAEFLVGGNF